MLASTIGSNTSEWYERNNAKNEKARFHYVVKPTSSVFRVTLNPANNPQHPKMKVQAKLPNVEMVLVQHQYSNMVALLERFSAYHRKQEVEAVSFFVSQVFPLTSP